ncbi:glycosyltransferase family 2 protein [Sediminispirochaeta bajacaliforniensis]|uniref:glycosyltransferase family 2 protein n=1 Tax=Sediminispirochaeta bajacaliforniensis TaxID=148 RepID=UPI000362B79E|nr:glycosyltransferase family 2 protein [Sediminispirochaeta bajacaliforniensis]
MKDDNKLISVMIPTYNQEHFIAQAVDGILRQDYENIEVIISDDCSTDGTFEKIKSFLDDPRISYYRNEVNIGRVENYRKTLYERTHGDWVINVDGDDILTERHYFSHAMKIAQENKNISIIYADKGVISTDQAPSYKSTLSETDFRILLGEEIFLSYWKKHYQLNHLTALYDRELALSIDFYCSDIISSDLESLLRLLPGHNVVYIPKIVGMWRSHGDNASRIQDVDARLENITYVMTVYNYLKEHNYYSRIKREYWKNKMLYYRIRSSIAILLAKEGVKGGFEFWRKSLSQYPLLTLLSAFDARTIYHLLQRWLPLFRAEHEEI